MTVTVAVDTTGADQGPAEVAQGALIAAQRGIKVKLFGPERALREVVDGHSDIEVIDAPVSIAKSADPVQAVRNTPESSIVQAVKSVAHGEADAFVAAGTTGPALAAGLFHVRRTRGVHRPALALPIPRAGQPLTFVDVGANVEARPEHLVQFAFMGAALAKTVLGIPVPKVGLLSNGGEAIKGTPDLVATHQLLEQRLADNDHISFIGNVEGTDLMDPKVDVVVADGFVGNVSLKMMEGTSQFVIAELKRTMLSNTRSKLGALLLRNGLAEFRERLDPELQGGAYLLGLRSLGVVPHGRFGRTGISEAIIRAARGHDAKIVDLVHDDLEAAGALRRQTSSSHSGS